MNAIPDISRIQREILTFLPEARAQVDAGWRVVERDFDATNDETTRRIRQVLENNPVGLPLIDGINFGTESGSLICASLLYPEPDDAAHAFDDPIAHQYVYLRDGTVYGNVLSKAVQALDPDATDARITSFGMGAIWAALSVLNSGDHIVVSDKLFGTTKAQLLAFPKNYGINVTCVDGQDAQAWQAAIIPGKTKAFFYEPVANPNGEVIDTAALAAIADPRDILVIVDASATPLGEFLSKGAHVVVISLTKFIGDGDASGGAVLTRQRALDILSAQQPDVDVTHHNPFFAAISPKGLFQAPEVSQKLLDRILRAPTKHRRQIVNACALSAWMAAEYEIDVNHSALTHANAPHLHSQIFAANFRSKDQADAFAKKLRLRIANNFGSPFTTIINPRFTTHKALSPTQLTAQGIGEGLLRLSIGIENIDYLKAEIGAAMEAAGVPKRQRRPAVSSELVYE
jgi:O-succinylhomoserine sulfhydrylase